MISAIDHLVLCVADVERSVAWYAEHLGLEAERLDACSPARCRSFAGRTTRRSSISSPRSLMAKRRPRHRSSTIYAGFDAFVANHEGQIEMGPAQLFGARGNGDGVYRPRPRRSPGRGAHLD
ncbi:MAG: VOC family protein [Acidimicrobiales bacterium]